MSTPGPLLLSNASFRGLRSSTTKIVIAALLAVLLAALAWFAVRHFPASAYQSYTVNALDWVREAGVRGALVYSLLYVAATVFFVPPAFLNTAAGFVWGTMFGVAVVYPANFVAAVLAFFLGRFVARDLVSGLITRNRYLSALDAGVRRAGTRFVFLLRLSPFFPFASLNYVLGLSSIRGRDYVLASLGTLPGTLLCVSLGALLNEAAELYAGVAAPMAAWHHVFLWIGVLGGMAAFALLARNAYQELKRATPAVHT